MSKPFFYRIDAGALIDFATDPEGEGVTLLQFAKALQKGESDIPFIQSIINEAHNYMKMKEDRGRAGGLAKEANRLLKQNKALVKQSKADLSNAKSCLPLASSSSSSSSSSIKVKKTYSSEVLRLTDMFTKLLLRNNPFHRELSGGKLETTSLRYAADIDKLIRIDNRPVEHVEKVILWSQQDDFWRQNILSAATLRKQWDKMAIKALRWEIVEEQHHGRENTQGCTSSDRGKISSTLFPY